MHLLAVTAWQLDVSKPVWGIESILRHPDVMESIDMARMSDARPALGFSFEMVTGLHAGMHSASSIMPSFMHADTVLPSHSPI